MREGALKVLLLLLFSVLNKCLGNESIVISFSGYCVRCVYHVSNKFNIILKTLDKSELD